MEIRCRKMSFIFNSVYVSTMRAPYYFSPSNLNISARDQAHEDAALWQFVATCLWDVIMVHKVTLLM